MKTEVSGFAISVLLRQILFSNNNGRHNYDQDHLYLYLISENDQ